MLVVEVKAFAVAVGVMVAASWQDCARADRHRLNTKRVKSSLRANGFEVRFFKARFSIKVIITYDSRCRTA